MDIKLSDKLLRQYLDTNADPQQIAKALTLCGPSVDRLHQTKDDYIYEIEIISNRVDSVSAFGVAREAVAILPEFGYKARLVSDPYKLRDIEIDTPQKPRLNLDYQIDDQNLVPHFAALAFDNITVKKSDQNMVETLEKSGQRSLNNLIDITNYLTIALGQPVHIFDYDQILQQKMRIRLSQNGEEITTLDGKKHTLRGDDIVIEDGSGRLIDLCGIMGGQNSSVTDKTTRALLFVQTYHPKKIRRTSLYTQERTLAAQIFEKNPDTNLVIPTLIEGAKLITNMSGGKIASQLFHKQPTQITPTDLSVQFSWINKYIGTKIPPQKVAEILNNLGFKNKSDSKTITVAIPSWRKNDITIKEDLVEEVARVFGYFKLPSTPPITTLDPQNTNPLLKWERQAKSYLADLGFTEIYNYSLVSEKLLNDSGFSQNQKLTLTNPLSEDYTILRPSLIPGLLKTVSDNIGKISEPISIFELSNIYKQVENQKLPLEISTLTILSSGQDLRLFLGLLDQLFNKLGIHSYKVTNEPAQILVENTIIGSFYELTQALKTKFRIPNQTYILELNFNALSEYANSNHTFTPISEFPDIVEDLNIKSSQPINTLIKQILSVHPFIKQVIYKDSYQDQHTFTVHFNDSKGNLTKNEIQPIKELIFKI